MAVYIDTVYQRVLSIANKEQRGYITPQEFNLLANQAQLEIFEQYFHDINQFGRLPGNKTEYSDMIDNINEKLKPFQNYQTAMSVSSSSIGVLDSNLHKLGKVTYNQATGTGSTSTFHIEIEEIDQGQFAEIQLSPLTRATIDRPYYVRKTATQILLFPAASFASSGNVFYNWIDKPAKVEWTYTVVNGEALYNSTNVVDFELHASEETKLVIKILELAGIVINKPGLVQIAANEEKQNIAQTQ